MILLDIFNQNVHNFLVDSKASSNMMPLSVCKKFNATPLKSTIHIIKLDRTEVKVKGELKDVLVKFVFNHRIHQTVDFIVVDIHKAYGLLLNRDWSRKLSG